MINKYLENKKLHGFVASLKVMFATAIRLLHFYFVWWPNIHASQTSESLKYSSKTHLSMPQTNHISVVLLSLHYLPIMARVDDKLFNLSLFPFSFVSALVASSTLNYDN